MMEQAYRHAEEVPGANLAAARIVPLILELTPDVHSVVDVGGGTGAWLQAFQEAGVERIQLYDTAEVASGLLIEPACFQPVNLNEGLPPRKRFDLAVCVECAEHLRPERAFPLVQWLTDTADMVVFSAALPRQPGKGHIHGQPPGYWQKLFRDCGFVRHDVLRGKIVNDSRIPYWYRQNLYLFTKPTVALARTESDFLPEEFTLMHRDVLDYYYHPGFRISLHEVGRAVVTALRNWLGLRG